MERGIPMPSGASARKVAEESIELVEVCSRSDPDRKAIMHELADVVLAAAVVAHHHGFTVEEAIRAKCELDTGREQPSAHAIDLRRHHACLYHLLGGVKDALLLA